MKFFKKISFVLALTASIFGAIQPAFSNTGGPGVNYTTSNPMPVNIVSGSAGPTNYALETGGNLAIVAAAILAQNSTTSGETGLLMQGAVTTAAPSYTTAKTNPLSLTTAGALRVDGSAVTQPINLTQINGNAIVTSNQNGTQAVGGANAAAGNISAAEYPILMSGSDFGGTPLKQIVRVNSSGNVYTNIAQYGGNNIVTGGVVGTVGVGGNVSSGASDTANPVKTGAVFNTTQPTVTTGQRVDNQATARGAQIVAPGVDNFAVQAAESGTWNITNISGTISLPTGAATAAKQPALGTAGTASSDVITVQGISGMTALKVDGSGVTQPISGTVTANAGTNLNTSALALEGGGNLATVAAAQGAGATGIVQPTGGSGILGWLSGIFNKLNTSIAVTGTFWQATQPISAASLPLPTGASTAAKQPALGTAGTAASDVITVQGISSMTALKVDGSGVTQPVSGTVTANQGTSPWVVSGSVTSTPSGTQDTNTKQVNGATVNVGTGAAGTGTARVAVSSDSSITANAGTNLNTSALALEGGGNLAMIAGAITSSKMQDNIAQWGGSATSLGQKVSASSIPVVVASDYNLPTVSAQASATTGTITTSSSSVTATVSQYSVATITISGTYAGVTINFLASDDGGSTYYAIEASDSSSPNSTAATVVLGTNASKMYNVTLPGVTNVKVLASAYGSGTANVRITPTSDTMVFNVAAGAIGTTTVGGGASSGAATGGNPVRIGANFNTTQPTVTTGQTVDAQATARGGLIVAPGVDNFAVQATQTTSPWVDNITQIGGNAVASAGQTGAFVTGGAAANGAAMTGTTNPFIIAGSDFGGGTPIVSQVRVNSTGSLYSNVSQVGGNNVVTAGVNGLLAIGGSAASGASDTANPVKTGAVFNTTQPTVTTGQRVDNQATARGGLIVATGVDTFSAQVTGNVASGSSDSGNPEKIGGVAINAEATAVTNGQRVNAVYDLQGRLINFPWANKENIVSACATATTTSDTSVIAAQGASVKFYLLGYTITNVGATPANSGITFKNGSGGSTLWVTPATATGGSISNLPLPIATSANTALFFAASTASTTITVCAIGFKGA